MMLRIPSLQLLNKYVRTNYFAKTPKWTNKMVKMIDQINDRHIYTSIIFKSFSIHLDNQHTLNGGSWENTIYQVV